MLFKNFKLSKQNSFSTEKERLLSIENQELISQNDYLKRELTHKNNVLKGTSKN